MNDLQDGRADKTPLNPALKTTPETAYDTGHRSPAPVETTSTKEREGEGWPWVWLVVTVVCVGLAVWFLI